MDSFPIKRTTFICNLPDLSLDPITQREKGIPTLFTGGRSFCCVTSDTENYKALYENATVEIQMFLNKIEEEKETIFFFSPHFVSEFKSIHFF